MKCFLTGVSGFIGQNLARQLQTDGHVVHAIVRGPVPEILKNEPHVQFYSGDLHDKDILKSAMEDCELVFHLAAFARPWSKDPSLPYRINVEGAENVFRAAYEVGVKRVVFTSSAATMSPSYNSIPANEATIRSVPYFNAYEITKAEAEEKAGEYCKKGLEVVIVNPSRVYGPGPINPSNSVTRMIKSYAEGSWRIIPGDGKKIGNYVFIDDVVNGHILAARKGRAGERYILGGENLTFDELFQVLAEVSGERHKLYHLPLPLMMSVARLMTWQSGLTGLPPLITPDFVKKYMSHWSLSSQKAVDELGYSITSFRTGVERTLEWLGC